MTVLSITPSDLSQANATVTDIQRTVIAELEKEVQRIKSLRGSTTETKDLELKLQRLRMVVSRSETLLNATG